MKYLLILFMAAFAVHAKDVKPVERMGQLQVSIPDLATELDFNIRAVSMSFDIENKATPIEVGRVANVLAGTGCLKISSANYSVEKCGIVINEKALTVVRLGSLKLTWDPTMYAVDVGPDPKFSLGSTDKTLKITATLIPASAHHLKHVFLLPSGPLSLHLANPDTGVLYQQVISISENTHAIVPVSAPDLRRILAVDFIDGKPSYMVSLSDMAVAYNCVRGTGSSYPRLELNARTAKPGKGFVNSNCNFFRLAATGQSVSLKAYPLPQNKYDVVINEHVISTKLDQPVTSIPVATINVHHFDSSRAGLFKVVSNRSADGKMAEVYFPPPNLDYLTEWWGATQTSVFLPYGFKYRFDVYATDDLGRKKLQDQIEMDLTKP